MAYAKLATKLMFLFEIYAFIWSFFPYTSLFKPLDHIPLSSKEFLFSTCNSIFPSVLHCHS